MKAFLRGQGWTVDQLADGKYAHKLHNLLEASKQAGLWSYSGTPNVDPSALEKVVTLIGPRFADYSYRYLDDQNTHYDYVKNGHLIAPMLDDLHVRIETSGVVPN